MPSDHSPGFRFKEGKLYLFGEESVMLVESWPALKAVRKERGTPWTEFNPKFRVVHPYRPRKPERATLSIVKTPDDDWVIGELKTRANGPVSTTTRQLVESWLDMYAMSA